MPFLTQISCTAWSSLFDKSVTGTYEIQTERPVEHDSQADFANSLFLFEEALLQLQKSSLFTPPHPEFEAAIRGEDYFRDPKFSSFVQSAENFHTCCRAFEKCEEDQEKKVLAIMQMALQDLQKSSILKRSGLFQIQGTINQFVANPAFALFQKAVGDFLTSFRILEERRNDYGVVHWKTLQEMSRGASPHQERKKEEKTDNIHGSE